MIWNVPKINRWFITTLNCWVYMKPSVSSYTKYRAIAFMVKKISMKQVFVSCCLGKINRSELIYHCLIDVNHSLSNNFSNWTNYNFFQILVIVWKVLSKNIWIFSSYSTRKKIQLIFLLIRHIMNRTFFIIFGNLYCTKKSYAAEERSLQRNLVHQKFYFWFTYCVSKL